AHPRPALPAGRRRLCLGGGAALHRGHPRLLRRREAEAAMIRRGPAAALGGSLACAALVACVLGATGVADRRHDRARLYIAERDALDASAAGAALARP